MCMLWVIWLPVSTMDGRVVFKLDYGKGVERRGEGAGVVRISHGTAGRQV